MNFLRKYGVAVHIYVPITKRSVTDQAVGADWTPVAGDVTIKKDAGAAANVTNLPTAVVMGNSAQWDFSLTATEMQAAQVIVQWSDAATKAIEDDSFEIDTYGNASAQITFDMQSATPTVSFASNIKKNQALPKFAFMMTDSTNHAPATGKTVVCTRSIDGGAFATGNLVNVTEVAFGIYTVDFGAADLNGNAVTLRATATGCDDTFEALLTQP